MIGNKFIHDGKEYQLVAEIESSSCTGCSFYNEDRYYSKVDLTCLRKSNDTNIDEDFFFFENVKCGEQSAIFSLLGSTEKGKRKKREL